MLKTLEYFGAALPDLLADLRELVEVESPSHDPQALAQAALWIERRLEVMGLVPDRLGTSEAPVLRVRRSGEGPRFLLLAHFDTVHPKGSFDPIYRVEGDRVIGPGVYDMKGGIVMALWAVRHLLAQGQHFPFTLLFTPDEEVGSQASRSYIEAEAQEAQAVLVLEPPTREGDLKIARKAAGTYWLTTHGRAAHQGTEPELGANAVVELARQISRAVELEDRELGTTVGPNLLSGGTAWNVVADRAQVGLDVRAWSAAEFSRVEAALKRLSAFDSRVRLEVSGGMNRPPLEPVAGSQELLQKAQRLAGSLGLKLEGRRVGGGSDGNFTAALGVPTLDGFGAPGGDAHQKSEYVRISELPPRIALLAGMLRPE